MTDKKGVDFFAGDEKTTFDLSEMDEETAQRSGIRFTSGASRFRHERRRGARWYKFPIYALCLFAYFLISFTVSGAWAWSWLVFFLIPLYYTSVAAIIHGRAVVFAYPVLVTGVFLLCGILWNLWNPLWMLFLTVPIFYWLTAGGFKRFWRKFPYSAFCVTVYLVLGFAFHLWHPGWIIFLTIPIFDGVVSMLKK